MDRWYGTDELRRSWCLLSLEIAQDDSNVYIRACEIGEANADQLIDKERHTAKGLDEESALLQTIGSVLDRHRYDGVSLITPSRDTLATLRTRFLVCNDIQQPTLRGFHHIGISELLEMYFSENGTSKETSSTASGVSSELISGKFQPPEMNELPIKTLWELRVAIGSLVPPDALRGTPL